MNVADGKYKFTKDYLRKKHDIVLINNSLL